MNEQSVFKILTASQWHQLKTNGVFRGSEIDLADGFIHLAREKQVSRIVKKYFTDQNEVYTVEFPAIEYVDNIKWESASNGEEFPHLYNDVLRYESVVDFQIIEN